MKQQGNATDPDETSRIIFVDGSEILGSPVEIGKYIIICKGLLAPSQVVIAGQDF